MLQLAGSGLESSGAFIVSQNTGSHQKLNFLLGEVAETKVPDKYSTRLRVLSKTMHLFIGKDDNNSNTIDRAGIQKDMRPQELASEGFTPHQI